MTALAAARAVLVGLETYAFGPGDDLTGPAEDAAAMGRLLVEAGLPPDRVDLLVACERPPRAHGIEPTTVTGAALYDHVNTTIRERRGDALIVFWAGHGFEYEQQQWLCLPEASGTNLQALNLTGELLPTLAGSAYEFPEQYYFVDACRTRYDRLTVPRGPLGRSFAPSGAHGRNRQHALLAAASGTETMSLPALATGVFSRALRAALGSGAGFPWPMDDVFERVTAAIGRAPVRVRRFAPDGGQDDHLAGPGTDAAPRYAGLAELGKLLAGVPLMTDPRMVARLVEVLEFEFGLPLEGPGTPQELVFRLGRAPAGLKSLLRLVGDRADLFPDHPATRALRDRLEAHRA